jgi:hypothetical protein
MTDERLADQLVERTLGWRPAPDRYVKPVRGWTPRSKFRPFEDVRDALRLLDAVTTDYSLAATPKRPFAAQVCVAGRVGTAAGESLPRAICLALAQALGIIGGDRS